MPYSEIDKDELILRDKLAADRTNLANERTLLAYLRTGMGFLVTGIAFLKFFISEYIHIFGYAFILFAVLIVVLGFRRYFKVKHILKPLKYEKGSNKEEE